MGAFDGEKLVGIHWHSIAYTGNDEQSDLKDVFDGQLYADNEDIAREIYKEFDRLIKGKYVVNYSFSIGFLLKMLLIIAFSTGNPIENVINYCIFNRKSY